MFEGHYVEWRNRRVNFLNKLVPLSGKLVLELGCGYGHVGRMLQDLGAKVVSTDARPEYVEQAKQLGSDALVYNVEDPWPEELECPWDLIVHWGLLYHTIDFGRSLQCLTKAPLTCLESEVCDSDHPESFFTHCEPYGYDQAASKHLHGKRASSAYIENLLGSDWTRYDSPDLNWDVHDYSWQAIHHEKPTGWTVGRRRFWLIRRGGTI